MERLFENTVKAALIMKLFLWAIITLWGALIMVIPKLFSKQQSPRVASQGASEDPYQSSDGLVENSRALRFL